MDILISTLATLAFAVIFAAVIVLRPRDAGATRLPMTDPDSVQPYWTVDQSYRTTGPPNAGSLLLWVMLVMLAFVALIAMVIVQTTVM